MPKKKLVELCGLLGGETRLDILRFLFAEGACPVMEIAKAVNQTHSATSHQLTILQAARVLTSKRSGRENLYWFDDGAMGTAAIKALQL